MKMFLKDKRNLVIFLLITLFLMRAPQEGMRFIFWMLGGIFFCGVFDFSIKDLSFRERGLPKSALITGFIISGILDYSQSFFALIVLCFLGVVSKYVIRFNKNHIFNPACFSLFLATLFKLPLTWKIESNIFPIVIFGIYLAYSFKKYPHILGFLTFFIVSSLVAKVNPFGIVSWFFIFIMLIEPKTSGYEFLRGFIFGAISGISSILVYRFLPGLDFFVTSLFIANLCNPLLDRIGSV